MPNIQAGFPVHLPTFVGGTAILAIREYKIVLMEKFQIAIIEIQVEVHKNVLNIHYAQSVYIYLVLPSREIIVDLWY